jgi:hypothetical protein
VNDAQRRKLTDDLVDPKKRNFESQLSIDSQRWFVEKLVAGYTAAGKSDPDITTSVGGVVKKAKQIAHDNKDFALALTADGNGRYTKRLLADMQRHRVDILYGAIAHDPELAEPARLPYLRFIAKRRLRAVCRMYVWVNPNSQGYFQYPHYCNDPPIPGDTGYHNWRVNEDAAKFWTRRDVHRGIPLQLAVQVGTGKVEPVESLNKLFIRKSVICKGNLFDCSTTASIAFMDALQEASDPDKLLRKLASKNASYLLIHQLGFAGTTNFAEDTSDEGVMKKIGRAPIDLQVGDRLYIYNHPLYTTFRPTGSWRGEHAFVYTSGNRNYRSKFGFVFGGHGMNGTLYQFYDKFLNDLKAHLALARRLLLAHLAFMRGGAPAIAPGTVIEETHPISIDALNPATGGYDYAAAAPYRMLQYDMTVRARDFSVPPTKTKRKPKAAQPGFLILQSTTDDVFYLDEIQAQDEDKKLNNQLKTTIAQVWPAGKTSHAIKFFRLTAAPAGATPDVRYAPENWGVQYVDRSTSTRKPWPFFEEVDGVVKRKELTLDDLFDSPFGLFVKGGTDMLVYQPKVDLGAAHQTFLTTNGAF